MMESEKRSHGDAEGVTGGDLRYTISAQCRRSSEVWGGLAARLAGANAAEGAGRIQPACIFHGISTAKQEPDDSSVDPDFSNDTVISGHSHPRPLWSLQGP